MEAWTGIKILELFIRGDNKAWKGVTIRIVIDEEWKFQI
jgi:hypothetical protein